MKVFKKMLFLVIMAAAGWFAQQEARAIDLDTLWYKPNISAKEVKFSSGGDSVFVRTTDSIRIYRTSNGALLKSFWVGNSVSEFAVVPGRNLLITGYQYDPYNDASYLGNPLITKWNTTTGDSTVLLRAAENASPFELYFCLSNDISLSRNGSDLAIQLSTSNYFLSNYIIVCNIDSFYIKHKWEVKTYNYCAKFSPTQDIIALGRNNHSLELYNSQNFEFIDSMPKQPYVYYGYTPFYLQFSNDGNKLFCKEVGSDNWVSKDEIGVYNVELKTNTTNINLGSNVYLTDIKICNSKNQVYGKLEHPTNEKMLNIGVYSIIDNDSIGTIPIAPNDFDISPNSQYAGIADTNGNFIMIYTPDFGTEVLYSIQNKEVPVFYPNPTNNILNIKDDFCSSAKQSIKIYSEKGTMLGTIKDNVTTNSNNVQFDIGNYTNGIYFVGVKCGEVEKFYKVVKY